MPLQTLLSIFRLVFRGERASGQKFLLSASFGPYIGRSHSVWGGEIRGSLLSLTVDWLLVTQRSDSPTPERRPCQELGAVRKPQKSGCPARGASSVTTERMDASMAARGMDAEVLECYLNRIGLGAVPLTRGTLRTLRAVVASSVRSVPFENLDVCLTKGHISATYEDALDRVVSQRRGGFCFTANSAISWLLRALGFEVFNTSARIFRPLHGFGPINTHITLIVRARLEEDNDDEGFFLVDVGNGNSCSGPVSFHNGRYQSVGQDGCVYVLRKLPDDWLNAEGDYSHAAAAAACDVAGDGDRPVNPMLQPGSKWRLYECVPAKPMGVVSATKDCVLPGSGGFTQRVGDTNAFFAALEEAGRKFTGGGDDGADFSVTENLLFEFTVTKDEPLPLFDCMCAYHQKEPDSPFLKGLITTKRLEGGGRLTLSCGIWIGQAEDTGKTRQEWVLAKRPGPHAPRETSIVFGVDALLAALREHFGIVLTEEKERRARETVARWKEEASAAATVDATTEPSV
jgi:arylamine N-acetyltransferase